jgi:hypothetical protein
MRVRAYIAGLTKVIDWVPIQVPHNREARGNLQLPLQMVDFSNAGDWLNQGYFVRHFIYWWLVRYFYLFGADFFFEL